MKTIGCIATDIVLYVSLVVILTVVIAKFVLAVGFAISMARRLGKIPRGNNKRNNNNGGGGTMAATMQATTIRDTTTQTHSNNYNSNALWQVKQSQSQPIEESKHAEVIQIFRGPEQGETGTQTEHTRQLFEPQWEQQGIRQHQQSQHQYQSCKHSNAPAGQYNVKASHV